jgi:hypothetical protein
MYFNGLCRIESQGGLLPPLQGDEKTHISSIWSCSKVLLLRVQVGKAHPVFRSILRISCMDKEWDLSIKVSPAAALKFATSFRLKKTGACTACASTQSNE